MAEDRPAVFTLARTESVRPALDKAAVALRRFSEDLTRAYGPSIQALAEWARRYGLVADPARDRRRRMHCDYTRRMRARRRRPR